MIRHLHDLAALESHAADSAAFAGLARAVAALDAGRGDQDRPRDFDSLLQAMIFDLGNYKPWRSDYETFIREVSYATDDRLISFNDALAALKRLVSGLIQKELNS
jgi:hypothetical protein